MSEPLPMLQVDGDGDFFIRVTGDGPELVRRSCEGEGDAA